MGVLEELLAREPLFHRPECVRSRADFERETAEDFWEVGASGTVYSREDVWAGLAPRYAADEPDPWEITDAEVRHLDGETYLITYVLWHKERLTRRATIWQRRAGTWTILYHQGTVVPD